MKKYLFVLAPLVIAFVFLFAGCANTTDDEIDTKLSFACAPEIEMKYGTFYDEPFYAPLITNLDTDDIVITYNENIIDYNIETGMITANGCGNTLLVVKSKNSIATLNINVVTANYCTSLKLAKQYIVKLDSELIADPIVPETNKNYNMGFDFISLEPNIAQIDENGVITPINLGSALIQVVAKSGIGEDGYNYIYKTTTVIVEECANVFNLEILDSDLQPLELKEAEQGFNYCELYSCEDKNKSPLYVLKYSSDINLKEKNFITKNNNLTENTSGTSARLFTFEVGEVACNISGYSEDGKTLYRPFYAVDSGTDYIRESLVDLGLNYSNTLRSDLIKLKVFKLTTEFDITVFSDESLTNELIANKNTYSFKISKNLENCNLYLKTHFNDYANTDLVFSISEGAIINNIDSCTYKLDFSNIGTYNMIVCPKSNSELYKIVVFEIVLDLNHYSEIVPDENVLEVKTNSYTTVNFKVYDENGLQVFDFEGVKVDVYLENGEKVGDDVVFIQCTFDNVYIQPLKVGEFIIVLSSNNFDPGFIYLTVI